mgnify:CR=1 FL=1
MSCSDDDLLFFCDIDMQFSSEFFRRLRDNTRKGVAYYPIIFSQYDPSHVGEESDHFKIDLMRGFWRSYGYGMVALYKEDFDKAGGFDVKIIGWGMEDVYLASNVISNNIGVMRSVDPELVHVYHDKHCDPDLSPQQLDGCIKEIRFEKKTFSFDFTLVIYQKNLLKYRQILERLIFIGSKLIITKLRKFS